MATGIPLVNVVVGAARRNKMAVKVKINGNTLASDGDGLKGNYQDGTGITITDDSIAATGGGSKVKPVYDHAEDYTLSDDESGSIHTNRGATGIITITLPAAPGTGTFFHFAVQEVQIMRIEPGANAIRMDIGASDGKYKWANAVGECVTLVADVFDDWIPIAHRGSWAEE